MLDADLLRLNPAQLARLADSLGLRLTGAPGRKVWTQRKSCTDPRTHREHCLKFSTKCAEADLRTAVLRASQRWEAHLERVMGSSHLANLPRMGGWASLESIHTHYLRAATCSPTVRKKNYQRLLTLVAEMFPEQENPAALTAEVLDGRLVRLWQLARKERAERDHLPHNPAGCERAKRSTNSLYRMARSVFSAAMLRSYQDTGLRLPPTIGEFTRQGFLAAAAPPPSEQLRPEVVAKIVRLLPRLRAVRPGTWAAFLLMFRGGLRNSEAVKARWEWLAECVDGTWRLALHTQDDYKPKAAARSVALSADVVELLRSVRRTGADGKPDAHLVPAVTDYERAHFCGRGINKFLRACGVTTLKNKIAYRLRGHAITEVMLASGLDAAREFAGHSNTRTTLLYKGAAVPYAPLKVPV